MAADGTLTRAGVALPWEDAVPEVAWASLDLFQDGVERKFFGFLRRCRTLRWVQTFSAGLDPPVYAELLDRGVRLSNSDAQAVPIAEYVLASVLDHFQNGQARRGAQARGAWERHVFREVHGTTWLIFGLGAIGAAVATRAGAFGAHVIGIRRHPTGAEPVAEMLAPDALPGALSRADVVVLCAPGTPSTRGLVDGDFLRAMRERSVLVNIARGSLVDETALRAALDLGVPELAVLDVFATEPLPADSPLWSHPRVRLSAHCAPESESNPGRSAALFFGNLARYVAGEPLHREVTTALLT